MSRRIEVHGDPLVLKLPEWMDTNLTYQLVRPDGTSYDVVWDIFNDEWTVMPF